MMEIRNKMIVNHYQKQQRRIKNPVEHLRWSFMTLFTFGKTCHWLTLTISLETYREPIRDQR